MTASMPSLEVRRQSLSEGWSSCAWPRCFRYAKLFVDERGYCRPHAEFGLAQRIEDAIFLGYEKRGIEFCNWCSSAGHISSTCPDLHAATCSDFQTAAAAPEAPSPGAAQRTEGVA